MINQKRDHTDLIYNYQIMPVQEINRVDYQKSREPAKNLKVINQFQIKNICLGQGRFSKIFACWDRTEKQVYAVKEYKKDTFEILSSSSDDPGFTRLFFKKQLKQVPQIYKKIRHKNVSRFHNQTQNEQQLHFYFQYSNSNSLQDLLSDDRVLAPQKAIIFMKKIIGACDHLSSQKIVHRNIHPSSILINDDEPKLSSFLLSKQLIFGDQINDLPSFSFCDEIYQAPEMRDREIVTIKSDVWSLGVLLLRMLYGKIPLNTKNQNHKKSSGSKIQFPAYPEISTSLKQMIISMLQEDYRYRPSMGLVNDFFKQL